MTEGEAQEDVRVGPVWSVLLVEELVTVRRGFRLLIETEPDFVVCGGASASRKRSKATGSQTSSCTAWSSPKRPVPGSSPCYGTGSLAPG